MLPFPEEYKIGNVYSMIVFGLDIRGVRVRLPGGRTP